MTDINSIADGSLPLPSSELVANGLRVEYPSTVALDIPHLRCKGGIIAVIGHNGAGKSTLIKSILGLLPVKSGALTVALNSGPDSTRLIPERDMAFCPETGAVFADISVESYIKLWCRIKHSNPEFYKQDGAAYLELLNIPPLLSKLGRELSKGQRRRVQTAIGFLTRPKLFLFDEPFDGLDVQRTSELADLILAHRARTTFVISSHRMDVMERLADQVLVLKQGTVEAVGGVEAVCSELAGITLQISKIKNPEELRAIIKSRYPNALISKLGNQILVTEPGLSTPALFKISKDIGEEEAQIDSSPPRLVDAINFHLAQMQRERLN